MFGSTFRIQARLALTACRTRTNASGIIRTLPWPSQTSVLSTSRLLSTSTRVHSEYGDRFERSPRGFSRGAVKEYPPSNTLFVGNVAYGADRGQLEKVFSVFGEVAEVKIATNRITGQNRGFAHVKFANLADATVAWQSAKEEPIFMSGRELRLGYAEELKTRSAEPSDTLFVGNFTGDEDELRNILSAFSNAIVNIRILKDRETGARTGKAFVEFKAVGPATEALNTLEKSGEARLLSLAFARTRRNQDQNQRF